MRRLSTSRAIGLTALWSVMSLGARADGQDRGEVDGEPADVLPTILVIGAAGDDRQRQPAANTVIDAAALQLQQPRSTEEALRSVPGISIKPEEETAIVANIGVRGLSSADHKTLMLEDGVPVAPGLFVGNGRYYNPRIQRLDGIEVLRGAGSLRYGPSTIGGVINYLTKDPEPGMRATLHVGSFATREWGIEVGAEPESGVDSVSLVISRVQSDGFMEKRFSMRDVMLKAALDLGGDQRIGVKFTDYANDANISYRGVFLAEYRSGQKRNPAPDDWFLTNRRSVDVNHEWTLGEHTRLHTIAFVSRMNRDYWRFATDNLASAVAQRWVYTDSVNGNNRDFERVGLDSRIFLGEDTEIGLRYMTEKMHDATVAATRETPRSGSIAREVIDAADSWSLHLQNRIALSERLAITAGVRGELYEQRRRDLMRTGAAGAWVTTDNVEWLPGVGATWRLNDGLQLFISGYRAFAPALNGDALNGLADQQLEAERSMNVEVGLRGRVDSIDYEATFFSMDFANQIIPANSNSQFQVTNGGKTVHRGFEFGIGARIGAGFSWDANATWIAAAKFVGDRYARSGLLTTPDGNRVPYTPEWIMNLAVSYERGPLRGSLRVHHTGAQFTDVLNTHLINESLSGFFTGRLDGYTIADVSGLYQINERLEFSAALKNLTDERYMASLRQGIYVGPERSLDIGVSYRF